jgi:hypothetical protein
VVKIFEDYGQWLLRTPLAKLFVNAEPGSQLIGRSREFCRSWPNQKEVTVRGIHFIQEDSPHEIGLALALRKADKARHRRSQDNPGCPMTLNGPRAALA